MFKYLIRTFVSFNLLISLLSIGFCGAQINPTKQEIWNAMSAEVDHWIDGAGYPIDKEIKETVIALNLMGIETTASCGGHLDHGLSFPWIDIQIYPPEVETMMQELSDIQEQVRNEEISLKIKFPTLSDNDFYNIPEGETLKNLIKKHRFIAESMAQIQIKCLEPLNQLLNQFYENRTASYDNILIIPEDSVARLRSIGTDRQQIRLPEQRLHKLNEYREEMKAFTIFLRQKFFSRI